MARKKNDQEVVRVLAMLRDAVRYSNLSNREVERKLGVSANSGYLSRLFAGTRELKLRQILDILDVVGLPPANFFRATFAEPDDAPEALRLERILAHAHPEQPQPASGPVDAPLALTEQQIEEMMKRTLRKLLFNEEPPPPPGGGRK